MRCKCGSSRRMTSGFGRRLSWRSATPHETRPTKGPLRPLGGFVKPELSNVDEVKEGSKFAANLLVGYAGRARLSGFPGIPGEGKVEGCWRRDCLQELEVGWKINPAHDMIDAAVEEKIK